MSGRELAADDEQFSQALLIRDDKRDKGWITRKKDAWILNCSFHMRIHSTYKQVGAYFYTGLYKYCFFYTQGNGHLHVMQHITHTLILKFT